MKNTLKLEEQNQAHLQQLVTNLPGVIYQYILHPDGTDECAYISPSCREFYQLEPEEIQQNCALMWGWIDPEEKQTWRDSLLTTVETQTRWQRQWQHQTPDGQMKWLSAVAQPQPQSCEQGAVVAGPGETGPGASPAGRADQHGFRPAHRGAARGGGRDFLRCRGHRPSRVDRRGVGGALG